MRFLKVFSLLVLLTIITSTLFCQTEFTQQGKVSKLELSEHKIKDPASSHLTDLSGKVQDEFRKILIKQIDETVKRLEDSTDKLKEFCVELWGNSDVNDLINDLKNISIAIGAKDFGGITLTSLAKIQLPITNNLLAIPPVSYKIYDFDNSDNILKLIYTNPFNKFIINYYNSIYSTATAQIKTFNLQKWIKYTSFLSQQYKSCDSLLQIIYANNGEMTIEIFQAIRKFHKELIANPDYIFVKTFVKDPWFKDWIWIRSGTFRLNPLDFTTDAFLEKYPEYDVTKSNIYEQYLDSVIKKYMLYDTTGRLDQFKKILIEKGTGKDQFTLKKRIEEMQKNAKKSEEQLTVTRLLNEVKVPEFDLKDFGIFQKGRMELKVAAPNFPRRLFKKTDKKETRMIRNKYIFHNFSFSEKDKFKTKEYKRFLTDPVRTGEIKKLAVHNIPANLNVELRTKSTSISDRSEFQEATDTLLGLAAQLAKWAVGFSPFDFVTSTIKPGGSVISLDAGGPTFVLPHCNKSLKEKLKRILSGVDDESIYTLYYGFYEEEIFEDVSATFPGIDTICFTASAANRVKITSFLVAYKTELNKQQKEFFEKLRKDSLMLSFLLPTFANSSLPPATLKEKSNEDAVYYSKLFTTDPSDSPVKYDLQLVGMKGKDSTHSIAKFTYKVGKNYRFQFGAGIAYTFRDYIQSKAKEENGQIVITNTAQNYRLITGVHVHFGKGLFLQDNRFLGRFTERSSFYVGVGLPKPLENVYTGLSYDLVPGLKLTTGIHLYRNDKYTIQNNSVIEQRMQYKYAGLFGGLQIDPSSLLKALNILK